MNTKTKILKFVSEKVRCFDGATGTMLMRKGFTAETAPEEVEERIMTEVHREYIDAGAEFITTNTFGGNRIALGRHGSADKVRVLNTRNTRVAKEAAEGTGVFVAGNIGPTGDFLKPVGMLVFDELVDIFREQAQGLADGGADLILIETMSQREELRAAIRAAKNSTPFPIIACATFTLGSQGYRTIMGDTPHDMVKTAEEEGADIIGANCTLSPEQYPDLVKEIKTISTLPILATPNAGQPELVNGETIYNPVPEIEKYVKQIIENGAQIMGGCCGTDPEYIRMLRSVIERFN